MECMVLTCQVHGSDITLVGSEHCGMGLLRDRTFGESDGLITRTEMWLSLRFMPTVRQSTCMTA